MKNTLRNIFLAIGFGTLIFTPMIIFDNGIDDTMKSVIIWLAASILYGASFSILKMKTIFRYPLHIIACFAITLAVRTGYSYFMNGEIHFKKLFLVTLPIFIAVYVLLFLYMKYFGSSDTQKNAEE
ncbi:hypothetical protein [Ruminococcus flavefaciens]|uniref:hypothetical protein n=1 Tax=Ruminococcus flavefaciens TaxID=1265 RepID=UPI0026F2B368|nr:hypothetical protein [Ruminococcus flavefaciens]MDD7515368.1 hypothetical protein [Ruminococcus flavefaciens]MDY5691811.1 hypothetical protein [Ruminococcus flavefaciens]